MTAIEYLVEMICTDVQMYDEEGNVNGVEYWNAFQSCTDLSEYINKAKEMEKQDIINAFVACWEANTPNGIECKLSAVDYYKTLKSE